MSDLLKKLKSLGANISEPVFKAVEDGTLAPSEAELAELRAVREKYGADARRVMEFAILLQVAGYGRNRDNAAALRAVADLMDSPVIAKAEVVEALLSAKGRPQ